jgi:cytosine/adenosine deaminase-related metal-dependent hydrolase
MSERAERQYRTRYHAQRVLPITAPEIVNGTVVVEGDRIVWVGARADAPPVAAARDVELGQALLLPGLVNAHTHLDLTVMRGVIGGLPFFEWVRTLVAARDQLTPDDLLDSARLGIREGLKAGITTFADTASSAASFDAMLELGVRGIAYHEVFGPDPAQCDASLAGLRSAIAEMRPRETALVRVGVSPHAPYSVSDRLFREVAAFARSQRLPLATHVAESDDESALVTSGEGPFAEFLRSRRIEVGPRARSPIALLEACGVLDSGSLLIHCVRCDAKDIATIAEHRSAVATCPMSNMCLWHGFAPVDAIRAAGIRLGVGSDSMASNDCMDVWREAMMAGEKKGGGPLDTPPDAVWATATLGGASALGLDHEIGSLEPGKQADLAALPVGFEGGRGGSSAFMELNPVTPGAPARLPMFPASLVVVAGRTLVRDGRLLARDDSLQNRVTGAAARLSEWRRASDVR